MKVKEKRDPKAVTSFFHRRDEWRRQLLLSDVVRKKPRLFALGYVLSERFDWEKFDCYPERNTIAEDIGVSVTQVSALTKELAQLGFLRIKRRRNRSSFYIGTMPQEVNSSSIRISTGLNFRKSNGLYPNVIRNVGLNEGGGAHAPAANNGHLKFNNGQASEMSDESQNALSSVAPIGANDALTFSEDDDPEEFFNSIIRTGTHLLPIRFSSERSWKIFVIYLTECLRFDTTITWLTMERGNTPIVSLQELVDSYEPGGGDADDHAV